MTRAAAYQTITSHRRCRPAYDLKRNAALGEHRAERVAQRVRGAAVVSDADRGGVLGDDVADSARTDRLRNRRRAGAKTDEQRVCGRGRADAVPAPQRVVRFEVQWDRAGAPAFGAPDDNLKRGLVAAARGDRVAPALVGLAPAFLDVCECQAREF
jgi:hypothetical protein